MLAFGRLFSTLQQSKGYRLIGNQAYLYAGRGSSEKQTLGMWTVSGSLLRSGKVLLMGFGHEIISTVILSLPLILAEQLSVTGERIVLVNLLGSLPRNSVVGLTDGSPYVI